tara:strand:- start:441 stop:815 length:375 start_codon:yes stop_codon:yes gene_type:complete
MAVINGDNGVFAWGNFKPKGNANTTWDSYNMSGITDNGTGRITWTFDTDTTNFGYVVVGSGSFGDSSDDYNIGIMGPRRINSLDSGNNSDQKTSSCYTMYTYPSGNHNSTADYATSSAAFIGRK